MEVRFTNLKCLIFFVAYPRRSPTPSATVAGVRDQERIPYSVNRFGAGGRSRAARDHNNYPLSQRGGPSHTSNSSMKVTAKRIMSPPTDREISTPCREPLPCNRAGAHALADQKASHHR